MFLSELKNEALFEAGFANPNSPRLQEHADIVLKDALRDLSSRSIITAYQGCADIHLNEGVTRLGRLVPKTGYNIVMYADSTAEFPSLVAYDPNASYDLPMDTSFCACRPTRKLYQITGSGSSYSWTEVADPSTILEVNPDVWNELIEDILDVFNGTKRLVGGNLSTYWANGRRNDTYVVNTGFGNLLEITAREQDVHVVYTKAIDVKADSEILLPNIYINLLKYYVAMGCSNVPEKVEEFKNKISSLTSRIAGKNVQNRVLQRLW